MGVYTLQTRIYREYPRVYQWSREKELLKMCHEFFCSEQTAQTLIEDLTKEFGCSIIRVVFCKNHKGQYIINQRTIVLPNEASCGHYILRLGIVIHEFAHVITRERFGRYVKSHGREFVRTFDECLVVAQKILESKEWLNVF